MRYILNIFLSEGGTTLYPLYVKKNCGCHKCLNLYSYKNSFRSFLTFPFCCSLYMFKGTSKHASVELLTSFS